MEMEAKKSTVVVVAVLSMLLLLMLSAQQQVAASAKSEFCACYKECYHGCRDDHVPRVFCIPFCLNKCSPSQAAAGAAAGDSCREGCARFTICGLSEPSAGKRTVGRSSWLKSVFLFSFD
jgi:hypothetical protein